jgi:hypothetical protein
MPALVRAATRVERVGVAAATDAMEEVAVGEVERVGEDGGG